MTVALVHHSEAESPAVDPQRPLTRNGRQQAEAVARRLKDAGLSPAAIWHSGKLRARQTAEPCLARLNPSAQFIMVRGLRPEDPPDWIRQEVEADERDLLLVGHMPNISAVARALEPASAGVPLHGFVVFRRADDGTWMEALRSDVEPSGR